MSGGPSVSELFAPLAVSDAQLRSAAAAEGVDEDLWDAILASAALDEHTALTQIAGRCGVPFDAEPKLADSADRFYDRVPGTVAREHHVAGLREEDGVLVVATARPLQPATLERVERLLGGPVRIVLSPRAQVANVLNRGYEQRRGLVEEIVEDMPFDESAFENAAGSVGKATDLLQLARQTPVIRLVNMILFEALRRRASDVHIHPLEGKLLIRFRVDGMLVDAFSPPLSLASAISSRLKVMADLDIANRHSPQDGQTTVRVGSRKIDIRLSCTPTIFGERLVLRLLDQSQTQLSLEALGMDAAIQEQLTDLVQRSTGIILVTGPTGSGKTTTLYAAMERIDRESRNVMTIEDPVEYHLDSIAQVQVNPKRGVTFASGLRSLLRQDPDVILVGEIRDEETARLAVQASLTGHLVLATLHTNDAPGAVSRLEDIGIEPYLITSSLLAVVGQRLLRRVSPGAVGDGDDVYAGRVAIHELMTVTDPLRDLVMQRADAPALRRQAIADGMRPMRHDGEAKVAGGITTGAELERVLHGTT